MGTAGNPSLTPSRESRSGDPKDQGESGPIDGLGDSKPGILQPSRKFEPYFRLLLPFVR